MADIRLDVNATLVPWVLINQPASFDIEFYNSDPIYIKKVTFPGGAPPTIAAVFNVLPGGGQTFTLTGSAPNGVYAYSVSNGTAGNGGIEIRR